jgi:hypothetical protein
MSPTLEQIQEIIQWRHQRYTNLLLTAITMMVTATAVVAVRL